MVQSCDKMPVTFRYTVIAWGKKRSARSVCSVRGLDVAVSGWKKCLSQLLADLLKTCVTGVQTCSVSNRYPTGIQQVTGGLGCFMLGPSCGKSLVSSAHPGKCWNTKETRESWVDAGGVQHVAATGCTTHIDISTHHFVRMLCGCCADVVGILWGFCGGWEVFENHSCWTNCWTNRQAVSQMLRPAESHCSGWVMSVMFCFWCTLESGNYSVRRQCQWDTAIQTLTPCGLRVMLLRRTQQWWFCMSHAGSSSSSAKLCQSFNCSIAGDESC